MVKHPDFAATQLAIFFKDRLSEPVELWPLLKGSDLGKTFNKTPLIIPLPDDTELDLAPAVTMLAEGLPHQIVLTRKRADLHWLASDADNRSLDEIKGEFKEWAKMFFEVVSSKIELTRIGYVNKFFYVSETPDNSIGNFLSDSAKKTHGDEKIKEVNVKIVTKTDFEEMKVNNNSTIVRGVRNDKEGETKGIMLTRDINTIQEKEYKFDWPITERFIDWSIGKLNLEKFTELL